MGFNGDRLSLFATEPVAFPGLGAGRLRSILRDGDHRSLRLVGGIGTRSDGQIDRGLGVARH